MRRISIFFIPFFFVSLLTFDVSHVFSQQPTQEWVATYPGPSNDGYGPFLQVDKTGNSYIAGTHVIGQPPNDSICILCAKYNTLGVQQWATLYRYPGQGYFEPTAFAIDTLGNAYVVAQFGPTYTSPLNGLIVKFNNLNGNTAWTRTYTGLTGASYFLDIKIDRQNNIYVAGACDTSHLLIRYNTNGDSLWVRKFHPPSTSEGAWNCNFDDSLNIVFTGRRTHFFPVGSYDSVLAGKYSPAGILQWENTYANNYITSDGTRIVTDQSGSIYIGGGTVVSGFSVFLTLKFDRNGSMQWVKIFDAPGSGDNMLSGVLYERVSNSLFATGTSNSSGVSRATTIKYNSLTGDSVWVKRDSANFVNTNSNDIKADALGYVYISGSTYNNPPTLGGMLTKKYSSGGNQIWSAYYEIPGHSVALQLDSSRDVFVFGPCTTGYVLIKYSQINGVKTTSNQVPQQFVLRQNYPNPFNPSTKIRFAVAKKSYVELKVYDILGKVKEIPLSQFLNSSEYELTLDCSNYSSGTYFYRLVADGNNIETKKMVVLK